MSLGVRQLSERLQTHYGDPDWWPGETPFEVAVGAILTQNTAWTNVEQAIANLRRAAALAPAALLDADPLQLQAWVRPSGYFRQKAERLRRLAAWWRARLGDDARAQPADGERTDDLRAELLQLKGVGPETADSILLYAFGRPAFVVDAYTARLATRLGIVDGPIGYDELQEHFAEDLPRDVGLYNRLHAQIVQHGKDVCTKRRPRCASCLLVEVCQGPVDLEEP